MTDAPTDGDDLAADFSDMKKKKKSKKAAFDLEAFEKELEETSKPAAAVEGGEGDEDADEEPAPIEYDEAELGDDVFAAPAGGIASDGVSAEAVETWHGTDRDYTYAEVSSVLNVVDLLERA